MTARHACCDRRCRSGPAFGAAGGRGRSGALRSAPPAPGRSSPSAAAAAGAEAAAGAAAAAAATLAGGDVGVPALAPPRRSAKQVPRSVGHGLGRGPPQGEPIRIARLWASLWRMSGITNARHQPRCLRVFACHNAVILAQPCVARLRVAVSDAFHRASPGTRGRVHGLCCAGMAQSWSPGEQLSRRFVPSTSPRFGRLAALNPGVQQPCRYGPSKSLRPCVQQSRGYGPSKSPRNGRFAALNPGVQQSRRYEPSKSPRCGRLAALIPCQVGYMYKLPIDRLSGSVHKESVRAHWAFAGAGTTKAGAVASAWALTHGGRSARATWPIMIGGQRLPLLHTVQFPWGAREVNTIIRVMIAD